MATMRRLFQDLEGFSCSHASDRGFEQGFFEATGVRLSWGTEVICYGSNQPLGRVIPE